jgi:hypothetical protein
VKGFVTVVGVIALAASAPSWAAAQALDTCALVNAEDIAAVVGAGATTTAVGDEQCNIKAGMASYEFRVRRQNAAQEMKDWLEFSIPKPASTIAGLGDEAHASPNGNVVIARKGHFAVRVAASGVGQKAPMPFKQGTVELARRILVKIK